jgi:hypothetical protein
MLQTFASPSAYQVVFMFQVPKGMLQTEMSLFASMVCISFQVPKGMLQTSLQEQEMPSSEGVSSPQGNATNQKALAVLSQVI